MFVDLIICILKSVCPRPGLMISQVVMDVTNNSGSTVVIWTSLISGIGIAAGVIIGHVGQWVVKYRETDQSSLIRDKDHEITDLRADLEDYKARWKEERDARLRAEADLERQRARDQS
jgi:hypothetical protein